MAMSDDGSPAQVTIPTAPAAVVEHREVLRSAIFRVEDALAAPSFGRVTAWAADLAGSLRTLEEVFADHIHITEGTDGLYDDLLHLAPRLDHRIQLLRGEHVRIVSELTALLDSLDAAGGSPGSVDDEHVEAWRRDGTAALGLLVRHRQRGIDLTFEAYRVEGGE
jgi:hypothetical protein